MKKTASDPNITSFSLLAPHALERFCSSDLSSSEAPTDRSTYFRPVKTQVLRAGFVNTVKTVEKVNKSPCTVPFFNIKDRNYAQVTFLEDVLLSVFPFRMES